jgi:hypothetical protein
MAVVLRGADVGAIWLNYIELFQRTSAEVILSYFRGAGATARECGGEPTPVRLLPAGPEQSQEQRPTAQRADCGWYRGEKKPVEITVR